jgi:hypothetical protein
MKSERRDALDEIEEYIAELMKAQAHNPHKLYFVIGALKHRLADAMVTIQHILNEVD